MYGDLTHLNVDDSTMRYLNYGLKTLSAKLNDGYRGASQETAFGRLLSHASGSSRPKPVSRELEKRTFGDRSSSHEILRAAPENVLDSISPPMQ